MTDATPARDARVERLGAYLRTKDLPQLYAAEKFAALEIREVESAGLLVLDPSDPALTERIARIQCPRAWDMTAFMHVTFGQTADEARALLQGHALDKARWLLNALSPDLPGGSE